MAAFQVPRHTCRAGKGSFPNGIARSYGELWGKSHLGGAADKRSRAVFQVAVKGLQLGRDANRRLHNVAMAFDVHMANWRQCGSSGGAADVLLSPHDFNITKVLGNKCVTVER